MSQRLLPDWLSMLLGLWSRTPRGLAARYAHSAHRSGVLKPLFCDQHDTQQPGSLEAAAPAATFGCNTDANADLQRAA